MSTKERPILMCGDMVRSTLDGRKTQTRRVCVGQRELSSVRDFHLSRCPYGQPGDRLWVRETHIVRGSGKAVIYKADVDPVEAAGLSGMYGGWKPSIFMPRWASRITLEIVSIRVERVQEITEDDAKAEGVPEKKYAVHYYCDEGDPDDPNDFGQHRCNWRFGFKMLWDSLNKSRGFGWDANPWVWRIEFTIVNHNNE